MASPVSASGRASTDVRRIPIDRVRRFRYLLGSLLLFAGAVSFWSAPQRALADVPQAWLLVIAATLLLTYRNYVEVNPGARRVAHRLGFVFTWPWTKFDTGRIDRVELKSAEKDSGGDDDDTRTAYVISVKGESGGQLCEHEQMFPARLVAERVARALNMPLENRLFGGWSVRKPEDLDVSLAERWRQSGRFKTAPVIEGATTLEVRHDDETSELSMPVARFSRGIAALVGASLVGAIVFLVIQFDLPVLIPGGFILAILYFTIGMILRHSGRDRLRFGVDTVHYRRGWLLSRQRMDIAEIEEILSSGDRLVLMGDRSHVMIDRPKGELDRELLRQFIERQIARRQGVPVD